MPYNFPTLASQNLQAPSTRAPQKQMSFQDVMSIVDRFKKPDEPDPYELKDSSTFKTQPDATFGASESAPAPSEFTTDLASVNSSAAPIGAYDAQPQPSEQEVMATHAYDPPDVASGPTPFEKPKRKDNSAMGMISSLIPGGE